MNKIVKLISIVLILILAVVVLTGCGNNEDKKDNLPAIVGTWKYVGVEFTYTFNADGTGNYDSYGTKKDFTYTTSGDNISILYTGNTHPFESTYSIDGDTLNIIDSFGKDTFYKRVK